METKLYLKYSLICYDFYYICQLINLLIMEEQMNKTDSASKVDISQFESKENSVKEPNAGVKLERVFGIILLIPPILSVLLFVLCLFDVDSEIVKLRNLSDDWSGGYTDGGGYTSAAPIYFGLMAIAGAVLLKGTDLKNGQK